MMKQNARARRNTSFRDIFGNPFRKVKVDRKGTDTVVSLACTMYESRDFFAMPILADRDLRGTPGATTKTSSTTAEATDRTFAGAG